MKVIAINGSPRKKGNTFASLNKVLDELKSEGIETELLQLGEGMSEAASPAINAWRKGTGSVTVTKTK